MNNKTDSAPTNDISAILLLNDKMVCMTFITEFTGLTDKWFYKLIKDGAFPKPIKLGRSSRWLQSEVEAWMKARIENSRT
ncbi:helix-turn-helix transcriptional regulator [Serratia fonticola]|uniref:helix-turn-helix transcriptional regulator n=1 Tax=Serratia fonticola TaxID=47917 RepID=UPI003BB80880